MFDTIEKHFWDIKLTISENSDLFNRISNELQDLMLIDIYPDSSVDKPPFDSSLLVKIVAFSEKESPDSLKEKDRKI